VNVHDQNGKTILGTGTRNLKVPHDTWTEEELASVAPCLDGHLIAIALPAALASLILIIAFSVRMKQSPKKKTE